MNKKEYCVISVVKAFCYKVTGNYFEAKSVAEKNVEYIAGVGYVLPEIYRKDDTVEVVSGLNIVRMPKVGAVPCYSEIRRYRNMLRFYLK